MAPVPATARANRRDWVATPDRWLMRLSIVRSAVRMLRAEPSMAASLSRSLAWVPSVTRAVNFASGSTSCRTVRAKSRPQTTRSWRAMISARPFSSAGTVISEVMSPYPARSSANAARTNLRSASMLMTPPRIS